MMSRGDRPESRNATPATCCNPDAIANISARPAQKIATIRRISEYGLARVSRYAIANGAATSSSPMTRLRTEVESSRISLHEPTFSIESAGALRSPLGSYLPAVVHRPQLLERNTKLELTRSASQSSGTGVAGLLIHWIRGARAVAVDALSFVASALALPLITTPEPEPRPSTASGATGFIPEMREGIDVVFKSPILWRIAGCTATTNLGSNMIFGAVFLVFAYRDLHLSAAVVGIIFGISSVGWLVGAFLAAWLARTFGLGMTLGLSILLGGLITLATPLALIGVPAIILSVLGFLNNLFVPVYNINQVSLRQSITPDRVQGRMNATMRTIVWGTIPVGAFTGGILGTTIGGVQSIILGSVVSALAALWIFLGPVARLKEQPVPAPA